MSIDVLGHTLTPCAGVRGDRRWQWSDGDTSISVEHCPAPSTQIAGFEYDASREWRVEVRVRTGGGYVSARADVYAAGETLAEAEAWARDELGALRMMIERVESEGAR